MIVLKRLKLKTEEVMFSRKLNKGEMEQLNMVVEKQIVKLRMFFKKLLM